MKYIGNKDKLMNWINEILIQENITFENQTVLDAFLGTGSFSKNILEKGVKKIYAYELLKSMCFYSKYNIFGIKNASFLKVKEAFLQKNNSEHYFYKFFSTNSKRNYFSDANAQKIDSMLQQWDSFDDIEKGLAIDMIDKVSNTSGTYGAYLKIWRSMALKNIEDYTLKNTWKNFDLEKFEVHNESVENFNQEVDIAYLDPPYNTRQYGSYYHVLERIVDRQKNIVSISGVLKTDSNSLFNRKKEHFFRIKNLIENLKAKIIIISYNNEGLISLQDWDLLLNKWNYKVYKKEYKRFKTNAKTAKTTKNNENLKELLFIVRK